MLKKSTPKMDALSAKDIMNSMSGMDGLVFACVEQDGKKFRCISYWDTEIAAQKKQRYVPFFYLAS